MLKILWWMGGRRVPRRSPRAVGNVGWKLLREQFCWKPPPPPYLRSISHDVELHVLHVVQVFPFHLRRRYKRIRAWRNGDLASFQSSGASLIFYVGTWASSSLDRQPPQHPLRLPCWVPPAAALGHWVLSSSPSCLVQEGQRPTHCVGDMLTSSSPKPFKTHTSIVGVSKQTLWA